MAEGRLGERGMKPREQAFRPSDRPLSTTSTVNSVRPVKMDLNADLGEGFGRST
ncbi:5-oxoprolinase subunit A OS=Streptomyces microflavus OX=1919 GN=pxpA PE=3 SV=1 [Streptomyces microflavus]